MEKLNSYKPAAQKAWQKGRQYDTSLYLAITAYVTAISHPKNNRTFDISYHRAIERETGKDKEITVFHDSNGSRLVYTFEHEDGFTHEVLIVVPPGDNSELPLVLKRATPSIEQSVETLFDDSPEPSARQYISELSTATPASPQAARRFFDTICQTYLNVVGEPPAGTAEGKYVPDKYVTLAELFPWAFSDDIDYDTNDTQPANGTAQVSIMPKELQPVQIIDKPSEYLDEQPTEETDDSIGRYTYVNPRVKKPKRSPADAPPTDNSDIAALTEAVLELTDEHRKKPKK